MRGGIAAKDKSNSTYNYVGNETKLYSVSATTHNDVTNTGGAYALTSGENWEFAKWGEQIIATCIDEPPQIITMGGANFADLGGTPPKARHIAVINNFVVLANIDDGTAKPQDVRWSAINDATSWAASADTQSDSQQLLASGDNGGGWIMGITGGEYGSVFQEYSIWRMTYVGTPLVFQFDEVLPGIGTPCKNSITQEGRFVHFLSQDGFCQLIDGSHVEYIGRNKVDDTFLIDFDETHPQNVIGASDPTSALVVWIYPGAGNVGGTPNKYIAYNWFIKKWAHGDLDLHWIYNSISAGFTLEELDNVSSSIDTLTPSLDDRVWKGGTLNFNVYDTEHKKGVFGGTALSAVLETPELQLNESGDSYISSVRPLVDGATSQTVQVGSRHLQDDSVTWTNAETPNSETGKIHPRANADYHRFRVNTTGDFTHAIGVEIGSRGTGRR